MLSNFPPKFTRHHQDWVYISNERVDLKCSRNNSWVTTSMRIHGNGILRNTSSCYIVGQSFQLYPSPQGWSTTKVTRDEQLMTYHVNPISHEEQQILLKGPKLDTSELDQISAGVDKLKIQSLDNILQTHETHEHRSTQYHFPLYLLVPSLVIVLCLIISCYGKPYWMPDLNYLFSCKETLQQTNPPEIKPRNSKRKTAQEETAGPSRACTGPQVGETEFVTYGAPPSE